MASMFVANEAQTKRLCEMFGIKNSLCTRLVIDIQVGEVVKAYANVHGEFEKGYAEDIARVLGTAEWKAEEVV